MVTDVPFVNYLINVYVVHSQCFDSQFLFTKSQVTKVIYGLLYQESLNSHESMVTIGVFQQGLPINEAFELTSVWLVYRTSLNIKQVFIINSAPANGRDHCNKQLPSPDGNHQR